MVRRRSTADDGACIPQCYERIVTEDERGLADEQQSACSTSCYGPPVEDALTITQSGGYRQSYKVTKTFISHA
jgi:hypothetical protein